MVIRVRKIALYTMLVLPVLAGAATKQESFDPIQDSCKAIGSDLKKIVKKLDEADKEIVYGILDKLGGVQRSSNELKTKLDASQEEVNRKNKDAGASKVADDKNQPQQVASPGTTLALAVAAVAPAPVSASTAAPVAPLADSGVAVSQVLPAVPVPVVEAVPAVTLPAATPPTLPVALAPGVPSLAAPATGSVVAAPAGGAPVIAEPAKTLVDSSVAPVAIAPVPAQGTSALGPLPALASGVATPVVPVAAAAPAAVVVPVPESAPVVPAASLALALPALPALPDLPPLPPLPQI